MTTIVFLIFVILSVKSSLAIECPINFCNGTYPSDDIVERFCQKKGSMKDRCCFSNDTIVGLDFRFCEIKKLNIASYHFTSILIMDLRDNNLQNITTDDLKDLKSLNELYLPSQVACPGGYDSWNHIEAKKNMTICLDQIDPCVALNISCPENGQCLHTGPGTAKCICKSNFHGYKCMNEGEFPTKVFEISLFASTAVLCAIMWFAIGRDANKRVSAN